MREHESTRLSLVCDGVLEMGWLLALAVTPLFFNTASNLVFEPDKVVVLRSIALLMLLAWIVKGLEAWPLRRAASQAGETLSLRFARLWKSFSATPVGPAALLLLLASGVATLASIAPRLSMWGEYARLQGLYTTAAYLVVFFSALALLRRRAQAERLVTTALAVSVPVALYGLVQHHGLDPISWTGSGEKPITSTLGNAIFLGGFLVLTIPLTLYRLRASAHEPDEAEPLSRRARTWRLGGIVASVLVVGSAWWMSLTAGLLVSGLTLAAWLAVGLLLKQRPALFLGTGLYAVVLALQGACLLLTQSRGPWLGLLAGLAFLALAWPLVRGRWQQALGAAGLGAAGLLFLILLNLPGAPLGDLSSVPYLDQLSRLTETATGTSGGARVQIWQGMVKMIGAEPVRLAVGYGPETTPVAFNPYYTAELGRSDRTAEVPDRAHNETFDILATTGLLGFTAYVLLFTTLFLYGLRGLGLVETVGQRILFLGLWLGGGVSAGTLVWLIDGSGRFFGVAFPLGLLAGLFLYLIVCSLRLHRAPPAPAGHDDVRLLVAAVLAAVTAHFVEIQFGIAVTATRAGFWVFAGLGAGLSYRLLQDRKAPAASPAAARNRQPRLPSSWLESGTLGLVAGAVLVTLLFDFGGPAADLREGMGGLLLFAWLLIGSLVLLSVQPGDGRSSWLRPAGVYATLTLGGMLLYVLFDQIGASGEALGQVLPYFAFLLLVLLASGFLALRRRPDAGPSAAGRLAWGYPVVAGLVLFVLVTTNLHVLAADIYYKQGRDFFDERRQADRALVLSRRAQDLRPRTALYHSLEAEALAAQAVRLEGPAREQMLQEAEAALQRARALSPLEVKHALLLGALYRTWAQATPDADQRIERFQQAVMHFRRANALRPNDKDIWNELGATYFVMGDTAQARAAYLHSLKLDPDVNITYLLLADLHYAMQRWDAAIDAYEKGLSSWLGQHVRRGADARYATLLGDMYQIQQRAAAAERFYSLAREQRSTSRTTALPPDVLNRYYKLATAYQQSGRCQEALAYARSALQLTSDDAFRAWAQRLEQQCALP